MASWQIVRLFAGTFILVSLLLGVPGSPLFVCPWRLALAAFVAARDHPAQAGRASGPLIAGFRALA